MDLLDTEGLPADEARLRGAIFTGLCATGLFAAIGLFMQRSSGYETTKAEFGLKKTYLAAFLLVAAFLLRWVEQCLRREPLVVVLDLAQTIVERFELLLAASTARERLQLALPRAVGAGRRRGLLVGLGRGLGRSRVLLGPPRLAAAAHDDAARWCWSWSWGRAAQVYRYWGSLSHALGSHRAMPLVGSLMVDRAATGAGSVPWTRQCEYKP